MTREPIHDEIEREEWHAYLADEAAIPVAKGVAVIAVACLLAVMALIVGVWL
jgi:hypothetical protein